MALKKLYRITDCNSEARFIQADSFAEAEKKFLAWENDQETTELIEGIVLAGDLIDGGTREEDIA